MHQTFWEFIGRCLHCHRCYFSLALSHTCLRKSKHSTHECTCWCVLILRFVIIVELFGRPYVEALERHTHTETHRHIRQLRLLNSIRISEQVLVFVCASLFTVLTDRAEDRWSVRCVRRVWNDKKKMKIKNDKTVLCILYYFSLGSTSRASRYHCRAAIGQFNFSCADSRTRTHPTNKFVSFDFCLNWFASVARE